MTTTGRNIVFYSLCRTWNYKTLFWSNGAVFGKPITRPICNSVNLTVRQNCMPNLVPKTWHVNRVQQRPQRCRTSHSFHVTLISVQDEIYNTWSWRIGNLKAMANHQIKKIVQAIVFNLFRVWNLKSNFIRPNPFIQCIINYKLL